MTTTLAPSLTDFPAVFEGFTITGSALISEMPGWTSEHEAHIVTVTNPRGRRYTTAFAGEVPTVEAVLEDLVVNAASFTATQDFEEWARETGHSWSTRAERKVVLGIYRHCERAAAKVQTFFTAKELFLATEVFDY